MWSFWIHTPLVVTKPGVVTPKKVRRPSPSLLYGGTSTEMYIAYINYSRLSILLRSLKRAPKNMQMSVRIKFSLTQTLLLLPGCSRYCHIHGIPLFSSQSVWLSLYFLGKIFIAQSSTNSPDDLFSASNTLVYARGILVDRAQNVRKEGLLTQKTFSIRPCILQANYDMRTQATRKKKILSLKAFPPAARTGLIKICLAHPKMLYTWPLVINVICSAWVLRPRNLKYVFAITSRPCSQTKKRVSLQSISIVPST